VREQVEQKFNLIGQSMQKVAEQTNEQTDSKEFD
jgi:hypothetical protein